MSVYELRITPSSTDLESMYDSCMAKLNEFFALEWVTDTPQVYIVPDRHTIDILKQKHTEPWVVGWGEPNHATPRVYLLSRDKMLTESDHTDNSIERYTELMMHELCHFFVQRAAGTYKPVWLHEGICMCVSGQTRHYPRPQQFTDFLEFFTAGGRNVYQEAGCAVDALVHVHGKDTLLQLLAKMKDVHEPLTLETFNAQFASIYGFAPTYDAFNALLTN